jgi:hypothetical protein
MGVITHLPENLVRNRGTSKEVYGLCYNTTILPYVILFTGTWYWHFSGEYIA